jgi:SPP1 family predicted phage head-tail adaptor
MPPYASRLGSMRESLQLQSNAEQTSTGGRRTSAWTTYATVPGEYVEPAGGTEQFQQSAVVAELGPRFRIRYRTDVRAKHQVLWKGLTLQILAPPIPEVRGRDPLPDPADGTHAMNNRRDATWDLMAAVYPLLNVASCSPCRRAACFTRRRRRGRHRRTPSCRRRRDEAMPVMQAMPVARPGGALPGEGVSAAPEYSDALLIVQAAIQILDGARPVSRITWCCVSGGNGRRRFRIRSW